MKNKQILQSLRDTGRDIAGAGLVIGAGGNISARSGRTVYIKRKGAAMAGAGTADYIPLDAGTGRPLRRKQKPSSEIYLHLACYRARKDINAVVHTHPVFATAMSMAGTAMGPVTYELEVTIGSSIARIGRMKAGTPRLGNAVGQAVKEHNAVLLARHGLVTVGKGLDEAFVRALAVERAALTVISARIARFAKRP